MGGLITAFVLGVSFTFVLLMALFFRYNNKNIRIRKIFSTVLFCNAALLLKDIVILQDVTHIERWYFLTLMLNNLIIGVDFLYVYELLRTGAVTRKTVLLSISPFVLLSVIYFIFNDLRIFEFYQLFSIIFAIVAIVNIIYYGNRYTHSAKRNYSDPSKIHLNWLCKSVLCFVILFVMWGMVYYNSNSELLKTLYYLVTFLILGYIGYKTWWFVPLSDEDIVEYGGKNSSENNSVESASEEVSAEESDSEPASTKDVTKVYYHFESELEIMRSGDFFCENPKISLVELADLLNTNRTTLSQYLNSVLNITFYDLTNDARIRHAEKLMADPNYNMTQEELALKCGFNSLSTFRRVFIDKKGCTPKKYYKSLTLGVSASDEESAD